MLQHLSISCVMTLLLIAASFANLPSLSPITSELPENTSQARAAYSNRGSWSAQETYSGDYASRQGDTVSYGSYNGITMWWFATAEATGADKAPGLLPADSTVSPWALVNSRSAAANGTPSYQWRGWNSDIENVTGIAAVIPTWRDGAEGAYTMTHDDLGAMPFDMSVRPGWDLAQSFPDIKVAWNVWVEKMEVPEWEYARTMVREGHEMLNSTMSNLMDSTTWYGIDFQYYFCDANDTINKHIYDSVQGQLGEHFAATKKCEYITYPNDYFNEQIHDTLNAYEFVGARGGAWGVHPAQGDFYHPFRVPFDRFVIMDSTYTITSTAAEHLYPTNPYVHYGLNELVDTIIAQKGYMVRSLHAVADIAEGAWYNTGDYYQWPLNMAAHAQGGWWGAIPKYMLESHYTYLQSKIDANQLTIYTPSEAIKYRMTANACDSAELLNVTLGTVLGQSSGSATLQVHLADSALVEKYRDEISVIISLPIGMDSLLSEYETPDSLWGTRPRRNPKKMSADGTKWSVSLQPFLGPVTLTAGVTPVEKSTIQASTVYGVKSIQNGHISLNLPTGSYRAKFFNAQGRVIQSSDIISTENIASTLRTSSLCNGLYFLQIQKAGMTVLKEKILIK